METTRVYESLEAFRARADKRQNGISTDALMGNYGGDLEAAVADNATNEGCWNCHRCTDCRDCTACRECTNCTNSRDCARCTGLWFARGEEGISMEDEDASA